MKVTLQTRVAKKFRWCRWPAEQRVSCAQTWKRGPPSALAEIFKDCPVVIDRPDKIAPVKPYLSAGIHLNTAILPCRVFISYTAVIRYLGVRVRIRVGRVGGGCICPYVGLQCLDFI